MARTETPRAWTDAVERPIALDPRSPYALDTRELGRRPGTMRTVQRTVPAPDDLGTVVIGVPAGSDLDLDLRLEAVMEGVLVSGSVRGRAVEELDVDIQELYHYPDRARAALAEGVDEEDVRELDGELIDVEPAIRDAVVPALPFRPVCTPDCPGLCPKCGVRLVEAGPDHKHETLDPRWAELGRVVDDRKEI